MTQGDTNSAFPQILSSDDYIRDLVFDPPDSGIATDIETGWQLVRGHRNWELEEHGVKARQLSFKHPLFYRFLKIGHELSVDETCVTLTLNLVELRKLFEEFSKYCQTHNIQKVPDDFETFARLAAELVHLHFAHDYAMIWDDPIPSISLGFN